MKVPRCMSTQHPDNVKTPFFSETEVIHGETEVKEAYYAYSHLGCTEQMWDYEGKEVDSFVVKKLLTRYEHFFAQNKLGKDLFLTLRVPNPRFEVAEAKVLLETLESIPRSFDAAKLFYDENRSPIFEVILPMTSSAADLNRIYWYYKEFVGGKEKQRCFDITIGQWVGDFQPEQINLIPLIEDKENLLKADRIVESYLEDKKKDYQRIFLARSDPALNYGLVSAVLLNKIVLARLQRVENRVGVELLPILGVGSAPFRGNFNPHTATEVLNEYPSVQTFTIQSAFKYDYQEDAIRKAIEYIESQERKEAQPVDEEKCLRMIDLVSKRYRDSVKALAPLVNRISSWIPPRRARKLHIGLFGYSREMDGADIKLPRAIKFCAALYSIGIPPEILGLSALNTSELKYLREVYQKFDRDMGRALQFLNEDNLKYLPSNLRKDIEKALDLFTFSPNLEHKELTFKIMQKINENDLPGDQLKEWVVQAASIRKFLG